MKEDRYKISNQKISVVKSKKYKGLLECKLNGCLVYLCKDFNGILAKLKQEFTQDIKSLIQELNFVGGFTELQLRLRRGGNVSIYDSKIFACLKTQEEK